MPFSTLGLDPALLHALDEQGFHTATAIQREAIPAILHGRDLLATARTGSGKTAAYCLPLLQRWQHGRHDGKQPTLLVLLPTRELAQQVGSVLQQLARHLPPPKIVTVYGGVSLNPQLMALRGGADIIVATPGRLLELLANNALRLNQVRTLVLDEADRLLEQGFADELEQVLATLPLQRQTLLFSATFAANVQQLATKLLTDAQRIHIAEQAPDIRQRAIEVDSRQRTALLCRLIAEQEGARMLVFVASKQGASELAQTLQREGIRAAALFGELAQGRRERVLENLKDGTLQVIVATDLAARGIDIPALPVVINYDLPRSPQDYTHRIGRTGRAGESGLAISLIDADSRAHFRLIEKRLQLKLPREQLAGFVPVDEPSPRLAAADDNGGIKGKRPSKKDKLRAAAAEAAAQQAAKPD
ncbi:superfamily II DNA/RNA helicase [Vogesella indigofera]|uniref:Superfamily II DNA/RNA helicase n=1 Tax=Vogesella indigofera TaxID=45465 RepID=A0A495BAE4_VOGIN|nr:DEAD/DEAH box helicase [Vogesella indigofera]RKQ57946.1 superfamily II DNA/RNA helicase [Vogesella indigofera]